MALSWHTSCITCGRVSSQSDNLLVRRTEFDTGFGCASVGLTEHLLRERGERTLRIEKDSQAGKTTIRLIGHFQSEHVEELKKQLQHNGPLFILDLQEVTVVDVEVVRFLGTCEARGATLLNCSPYIRDWIGKERD
jgi:hypothetical protein